MTRRTVNKAVWASVWLAGLALALALACGCQGGGAAAGQSCSTYQDCSSGSFCARHVDTTKAECAQAPIGTCVQAGSGDSSRYQSVDPGAYDSSCDDADPCPAPYECTYACEGHENGTVCLLPCQGGDCPAGFFCNGASQSSDQGAVGYCVRNV